MPSKQIGIAIIGSGIFVKEEHLPAVHATPSLKLRAIYSRRLASAKETAEKFSDVDLYSSDAGEGKDYADLLARSDIEAVVIALPILVQANFIKQALEAGKHVFAEKPIAKDVATGKELLQWADNNVDRKKINFSIAENFRFMDSFDYAADQVKTLGRILEFRVKVSNLVKGGKWYETEWRKNPGYQGGFLLDGGVHTAAAVRLLLSSQTKLAQAVGHAHQLQPHLPPHDTINGVLLTESGVSGTFALSFGTTLSGSDYEVACEKGRVHVSRSKVTVTKNGQEPEFKEFTDEGSGVKQEFKAFADALLSGIPNPKQSPEEALRDVELIEAFLTSDGKIVKLTA